jgi:MPBQ/MSBQ methyltransferase
MGKRKIDTQAVGLDVGLAFTRWLTGAENLHYGYWEGLEPAAANLRAAQEAYTARLFELLPPAPARLLDIGGGAGETAAKLLGLGYTVEIVVPSAFLAERCRANAPGAVVHECRFEDFTGSGPFDICLFSESFQYVALDRGLARCAELLEPGGSVVLADCFRPEGFVLDKAVAKVGGGHRWEAFRAELARQPFALRSEEEITAAVAPSVEIEQGLFNVVGYGLTRADAALAEGRPLAHRALRGLLRLALRPRARARLDQRLNRRTRTAEAFRAHNRYVMMRLERR